MNNILERCCGLDVHKDSVVACSMIGTGNNVKKEIRKFGTMTEDIRALADWLKQLEIKDVVVESTGVYWKPIFNIFEEDFNVTLANAAHVKNIPGRKTDIKLATVLSDVYGVVGWQIIQSLAHGIRDPKKLIAQVPKRTNVKASKKEFLKALEGTLTDNQIKLLALLVQSVIEQEKHITNVEQQMFDLLKQYEAEAALLELIPCGTETKKCI